jgi:hypothetical protein
MQSILCVLALLCLALQSYAQVPMTGAGKGSPGGGASAYSGPGDQVASANAWYGLRGYSAAYSTGSNAALTVRCASGASSGSTFVINILSSGALDIATASSDCGTDGVVTGTIATTVLSISAKTSGQVTIGDQITGTGISNPTYVISAGTCTSGAVTPPCTFNLSRSNTVSSETITAAAGMYVTQLNDQTGNGFTITATTANQLNLLTNCLGALPCMGRTYTGTATIGYSGTFTTVAAPFSLEGVAERITVNDFPVLIGGSAGNNVLQWRNSANTMGFFTSTGILVTATASDGAAHVFQGIAVPVSGNILNIDNVATTGTGAAGFNLTSPVCFPFNCGQNDMTGYVFEGGIWPIAFTTTQQTNICHNAYGYWGTSTSC